MSTLDARVQARVGAIALEQQQAPRLEAELMGCKLALQTMDLRADPEAYMATQARMRCLEKQLQQLREADVDYLLQAIPYVKDSASTVTHSLDSTNPFKQLVTVQKSGRKGHALNRYMLEVDNDPEATLTLSHNRATDTCTVCKDVHMQIDIHLSMLVCPDCGLSRDYLDNSEQNLTYDQEQQMSKTNLFCYQRKNHLADWLNSVSGRENTEIPAAVLDALKAELRKDKVTMSSKITPVRIKRYLKKLKHTNLYEHATYITQLLNGKPAPTFSPELEEKLNVMFNNLQQSFERHKGQRANSLSYSYLLYKLCELLSEDWALEYFPLLKCSQKLWACDQCWRKICHDLNWEFIASV